MTPRDTTPDLAPDALLAALEPWIAFVARCHTGDRDELTQAGRVAAWDAWRRYDAGKGPWAPWVYAQVAFAVRKAAASAPRVAEFDPDSPLLATAPDPSVAHARAAREEWAVATLAHVRRGADARTGAVLDGMLEGRSQSECAREIGVSRQRAHQLIGGLAKTTRQHGLTLRDVW